MTKHHIKLLSVILAGVSLFLLYRDRSMKWRPVKRTSPVELEWSCDAAFRFSSGASGKAVPDILITERTGGQAVHVYQFHPFRGKIDINKAPARLLQILPGIGPSLAERIIEERFLRGSFSSVADLSRVRGITSEKINNIRELVETTP